ncbi:fatty acid CoA ligase family protein [Nocardia halotolerans]|uniref:Fatty acid CoA ligase family protein n=1 Tax=Nocardia halotolerans TaxID=1755878 RepID=A0ABV8VA25_9NOCA
MTTATYWQTIDRFRDLARTEPDRAAVIYPDGTTADGLPDYRRITYRELDRWSDAIAGHLTRSGVRSGTRTIVLVLPSPELYAILFALLKIGAVPVVIDPGMGVRRMVHCLRAVAAEAFIGIPQAHALRVLFPRSFRQVRTTLTVGRRWFWRGPTLRSWGRTPAGELPTHTPADPDELLIIGFTTGSTGPAKAVELTHGNLAAMVEEVHAARGHTPPDTSLVTLPLVGVLDLLLGSRCVLPPLIPSKVGSTDPAHVVDAIQRFGVRTMFASPAVLIPLLARLRAHPTDLDTLDSVFSGGAPVPHWCVAGLRSVLRPEARIYAGYGSTEALPLSTIESRELLDGLVEQAQQGAGTCIGRPTDNVEVRLLAITDDPVASWAEAGLPVDAQEVGELVVAGPHVSARYFWPPAANTVGKIVDGDRIWHRTGDLVRIDELGRIWFCGRKSQRVRTAHGPMFTVQVEQVFNAVRGVARTALVGVGTPGAQRPVLCVELEPGADPVATQTRLRTRATEFDTVAPIAEFLIHPGFPVDIRHNAKIGREQLARWAAKKWDVRI